MDQTNQVYATLLTNINYLPGVLLLAFSLEKVQSRYALVILVIPGLPKDALAVLEEAKLEVIEVEWLEPRRKGALDGHDARFADTWTKLAVFGVDRFMVRRRTREELPILTCKPHSASSYSTRICSSCATRTISSL